MCYIAFFSSGPQSKYLTGLDFEPTYMREETLRMPASMETSPPHLAWETSASTTNPTISDRLPEEVATCLQNARFLHLATCNHNQPHVSLMNYTYLPPNTRPPSQTTNSSQSSPLPSGPTIIMTSNPSSRKTTNLLDNPKVSLLVHDWVSTRPPNVNSNNGRERSPASAGRASSLANMLMQMNSAAVSSISATINGEAHVLEPGTEEEKWCKEQHLLNNTFTTQEDTVSSARTPPVTSESVNRLGHQQRALSVEYDQEGSFGTSPADGRAGDGGRGSYIEDEEVRVVVVRIKDGRISDWKGGVKDWVIQDTDQLPNGVDGET